MAVSVNVLPLSDNCTSKELMQKLGDADAIVAS